MGNNGNGGFSQDCRRSLTTKRGSKVEEMFSAARIFCCFSIAERWREKKREREKEREEKKKAGEREMKLRHGRIYSPENSILLSDSKSPVPPASENLFSTF